jgi:hypothetical protein
MISDEAIGCDPVIPTFLVAESEGLTPMRDWSHGLRGQHSKLPPENYVVNAAYR